MQGTADGRQGKLGRTVGGDNRVCGEVCGDRGGAQDREGLVGRGNEPGGKADPHRSGKGCGTGDTDRVIGIGPALETRRLGTTTKIDVQNRIASLNVIAGDGRLATHSEVAG